MSGITFTDQIAAVALFIAIISLVITISQSRISKKTFERDTLLKVQEHAISNDIANKFELIAVLEPYSSYNDFVENTSDQDVKHIQQVVAHLNYCAQLVHEGYLKQQLVWNRYFWMYRICNAKLLPWWICHHQSIHRNRFSNFEKMCSVVSRTSESKITEFDNRNAE